MKLLLFFILSTTVAVYANPLELRHEEFRLFKVEHGKEYKTQEEEQMRLKIFSDNLRKIEEHNQQYEQGLETYTMGVNQFTDWSHEEFMNYLTAQSKPPTFQNIANLTSEDDYGLEAPASIDWRQHGAVTGVKNQGQCGSCWSFSVTGAIEGAYYIAKKRLISLSEQNLVDCDTSSYGCRGGFMQNAFNYVARNGIASEGSYPYRAYQQRCRYNSNMAAVRIRGYVRVSPSENALKEAVATHGPISVGVDASSFQSYSGGIFYSARCSTNTPNHGVLVVGYGSANGRDYWLVKNSWGASWGERGYIRMIRNYNNNCGIASDANYAAI